MIEDAAVINRILRHLGVPDEIPRPRPARPPPTTSPTGVMAGAVSNDPAPDLLALSPSGNRVYVTLRGPNPLTGNNPAFNNAQGSTPGLGIVRVLASGMDGALQAAYRISNLDAGGVERADPHGLAVRLR